MSRAPYYSGDGITLFHGDCREITEWLSADVLVTDPPYGMSYVSNRSKYGSTEPIVGDDDPGLRDAVLQMWEGRPALAFGTWRVPRPTATRTIIVWDKGDCPGMGDLSIPWGPSWEEVYVMGSGWVGRRGTSVIRVPTLPAASHKRPAHPTPKPVSLMERLILQCPPGVIADPFAGSGATLVAARNLNRQAVGVELSEKYCELIARRLAQGALDFGDAA